MGNGNQHFSAASIAELNATLAPKPPQELLEWGLSTFGRRIALCCGFGLEGVVLLDMLMKLDSSARVFTIDTGRLAPETYDLIDRAVRRYGVKLEIYFPSPEHVEPMVSSRGMNLFYDSIEHRLLCCQVRKVLPLGRALRGLSAWVTGLRRGQSHDRRNVNPIEFDSEHDGIVKLNPLAAWSEAQVWQYIRAHNVLYNPLYDRGYGSIGCAPCTRPVQPGEDLRAGRWWWETDQSKECGIHNSPVRRNGVHSGGGGSPED